MIKVLATSANVQEFRGLIKLMMLTPNSRLLVLPLATGEGKLYTTIKFYLLDLALRCSSDLSDSHLYRDRLVIMRSLTHDISSQLKDEETVEEIHTGQDQTLIM